MFMHNGMKVIEMTVNCHSSVVSVLQRFHVTSQNTQGRSHFGISTFVHNSWLEGILWLMTVHTVTEEQTHKTSCAAEPYLQFTFQTVATCCIN